MKVFDGFCGIGGIRLAFDKFGFETIYANDIDVNCKTTYDLNFDTAKITLGDINMIKIKNLPDIDVVTSGFSCQPFSIAGEQKGLEDERAQVIYKLLEIVKKKKPKVVFIENVKNFKSVNAGEAYHYVCDELKKYGYHIKDQILNSCEYSVVPQNRERIYIIAFKNKKHYDKFKFPPMKYNMKPVQKFLEKKVDDKYYYKEDSAIYPKLVDTVVDENIVYQYRRYYVRENKSGTCPTLTANMGTGGHNVPIILDKKGIRKLTPRECFNLQGFPKDYKLGDLADSHLYKQAGNSVTVPVIKRIVKRIKKAMTLVV